MEAKKKTLYMPLSHSPGEAQFDFGFTDCVRQGKKSLKTEKNRKVLVPLAGKRKVAIVLLLALHNWRATRCTFQMPPAESWK